MGKNCVPAFHKIMDTLRKETPEFPTEPVFNKSDGFWGVLAGFQSNDSPITSHETVPSSSIFLGDIYKKDLLASRIQIWPMQGVRTSNTTKGTKIRPENPSMYYTMKKVKQLWKLTVILNVKLIHNYFQSRGITTRNRAYTHSYSWSF